MKKGLSVVIFFVCFTCSSNAQIDCVALKNMIAKAAEGWLPYITPGDDDVFGVAVTLPTPVKGYPALYHYGTEVIDVIIPKGKTDIATLKAQIKNCLKQYEDFSTRADRLMMQEKGKFGLILSINSANGDFELAFYSRAPFDKTVMQRPKKTNSGWDDVPTKTTDTDKDEDGVSDKEDVCPDEKGTKANRGCPEKNENVVVNVTDEKNKPTRNTNPTQPTVTSKPSATITDITEGKYPEASIMGMRYTAAGDAVKVVYVIPNSPMAKAGIRKDDIIKTFTYDEYTTPLKRADQYGIESALLAGTPVSMQVLQSGILKKIPLKKQPLSNYLVKCISGNCTKGIGKATWLPDGSIVEGEFDNGLPEGKAKRTTSFLVYEGKFLQGGLDIGTVHRITGAEKELIDSGFFFRGIITGGLHITTFKGALVNFVAENFQPINGAIVPQGQYTIYYDRQRQIPMATGYLNQEGNEDNAYEEYDYINEVKYYVNFSNGKLNQRGYTIDAMKTGSPAIAKEVIYAADVTPATVSTSIVAGKFLKDNGKWETLIKTATLYNFGTAKINAGTNGTTITAPVYRPSTGGTDNGTSNNGSNNNPNKTNNTNTGYVDDGKIAINTYEEAEKQLNKMKQEILRSMREQGIGFRESRDGVIFDKKGIMMDRGSSYFLLIAAPAKDVNIPYNDIVFDKSEEYEDQISPSSAYRFFVFDIAFVSPMPPSISLLVTPTLINPSGKKGYYIVLKFESNRKKNDDDDDD